MSNQQEAILHFEQVIKHASNVQEADAIEQQILSAKSLIEIILVHIDQRDFYEANYQLDRAFYFGFQNL